MAICIACGNGAEGCLCSQCEKEKDKKELCTSITEYSFGSNENELWEKIAGLMSNRKNFKSIVFSLSADFEEDLKKYHRILAIENRLIGIPKVSRAWFYELYDEIKESRELEAEHKNRLKGILLNSLYSDYRYFDAQSIADELLTQENMHIVTAYYLADFYSKTRRYEMSESIISNAISDADQPSYIENEFKELNDRNGRYRLKTGYMPKNDGREPYQKFMESIGIPIKLPEARKEAPKPIAIEDYPEPVEITSEDFNTFVAFDLETTGRDTAKDSIIEFGAVKVVNGQIVDSAEFTFQEFAKPFKRKLREDIKELTGIKDSDLEDAREMWEVAPDFLEFVGDSILVGFNCILFDSKFMARAGRYSHRIIENKYFDVMQYAKKFKNQLGIESAKVSLKVLTEKLGIVNPDAHRALGDAITTAKIFIKLKSMEVDCDSIEADLDDLENW